MPFLTCENKKVLLICGGVFGAVAAGLAYYHQYKKWKNWKQVGVVSRLFIYPVKSMKEIEVKSLVCGPLAACLEPGVGFDRSVSASSLKLLIT